MTTSTRRPAIPKPKLTERDTVAGEGAPLPDARAGQHRS